MEATWLLRKRFADIGDLAEKYLATDQVAPATALTGCGKTPLRIKLRAQGLKSVRENFGRLSGTCSKFPLDPSAKALGYFRNTPLGLFVCGSVHPSNRNFALTHTLKAMVPSMKLARA